MALGLDSIFKEKRGFPGGSDGKDSAAVQETQVQSLSREDLLEKGVATHSNILTWRIPRTEEPDGAPKSRTQLSDFTFHFLSFT